MSYLVGFEIGGTFADCTIRGLAGRLSESPQPVENTPRPTMQREKACPLRR
jgi:hypothetical protein